MSNFDDVLRTVREGGRARRRNWEDSTAFIQLDPRATGGSDIEEKILYCPDLNDLDNAVEWQPTSKDLLTTDWEALPLQARNLNFPTSDVITRTISGGEVLTLPMQEDREEEVVFDRSSGVAKEREEEEEDNKVVDDETQVVDDETQGDQTSFKEDGSVVVTEEEEVISAEQARVAEEEELEAERLEAERLEVENAEETESNEGRHSLI